MDNLDEMELKLLRKMNQEKDAELARLKAEDEQLLRELKMQGEMREKETK